MGIGREISNLLDSVGELQPGEAGGRYPLGGAWYGWTGTFTKGNPVVYRGLDEDSLGKVFR